jgi:hypothetical protein
VNRKQEGREEVPNVHSTEFGCFRLLEGVAAKVAIINKYQKKKNKGASETVSFFDFMAPLAVLSFVYVIDNYLHFAFQPQRFRFPHFCTACDSPRHINHFYWRKLRKFFWERKGRKM